MAPRVILIVVLSLALRGAAWPAIPPGQTSSGQASPLTDLPAIAPESFPPALQEKVRAAYDAARARPDDPAAVGRLGMILQAYHYPDQKALACYGRAHALDPKSFRWVYYLGMVHAARGSHAEAVQAFREALRLDPQYFPAQLKLGEALIASGAALEARKLYEEAVRRYPESAQAWFGLGRAQAATEDQAAAVESLRRACDLFPQFGAAHYALALAYRRLKRPEEAKKELELYEKNKRDVPGAGDRLQFDLNDLYTNPSQLIEMGIDYAGQGDLERAAAEHERALEFDPRLLRAHINLISIYGRLGQSAKAEEHYRAAVAIDPSTVEGHYNFGVMLLQQGKSREAEEPFRKALQADPRHADAHNNLGDVLQRQGRLPEAVEEFQKALEARPDFPQAHFNLGRIRVNQNEYARGIQELLKALSPEDPDTAPAYLYAVGAAYARAGDRQNAAHYLRSAQEKARARQQTTLQERIARDLERLGATARPD